jgi:hypothetical protein
MLRISSAEGNRGLDHPSVKGIGLVSVCWVIFFGMLVFYGAQTPYEARVAKAIAAQDAIYGNDEGPLAKADEKIVTGSVPAAAAHLGPRTRRLF